MKRVTVTLPDEIVEEIDLRESNRSRFLTEAAVRELTRRRRQELRRSLEAAHPDGGQVAEAGLPAWAARARPGDETLLDPAAGRPVQWIPGKGWQETAE